VPTSKKAAPARRVGVPDVQPWEPTDDISVILLRRLT
jgi:hypothetical protein